MRVLFDTNIILDLLLDRKPHAKLAAALVAEVEHGTLSGYLCATTLTTIFYLARKIIGTDQARIHVQNLLHLFEVAPVNRTVLEGALVADFTDFEDAVLHEAAKHIGAQCIVTRNNKDFKAATLPIYLPQELRAMIVDLPTK